MSSASLLVGWQVNIFSLLFHEMLFCLGWSKLNMLLFKDEMRSLVFAVKSMFNMKPRQSWRHHCVSRIGGLKDELFSEKANCCNPIQKVWLGRAYLFRLVLFIVLGSKPDQEFRCCEKQGHRDLMGFNNIHFFPSQGIPLMSQVLLIFYVFE